MEELLDGLFQTPLTEFVTHRNELAKRAKTAGDAEGATGIKALRKPSAAAWVVNQLYFLHRGDVDRLQEANLAIRAAHQDPAGNLKQAMETRRARFDQLMSRATEVMTNGGIRPTKDQTRRVSATLDAATTPGSSHLLGRLGEDLEPVGFGALTGFELAPSLAVAQKPSAVAQKPSKVAPAPKPASPQPPPPRPTPYSPSGKRPSPRPAPGTETIATAQADLTRAQVALDQEEVRLGRAEREATRAETASLAAVRHVEKLQTKIEELRARVAKAEEAHEASVVAAQERSGELTEARSMLSKAVERARLAREAVDLASAAVEASGPDEGFSP